MPRARFALLLLAVVVAMSLEPARRVAATPAPSPPESSSSSSPAAQPAPHPELDVDLLRAELERFRVHHGIDGLAAAVVTANEELLVEGFGERGAPTGSTPSLGPVEPTTRFALGGAGIPLVSTLMAILVDSGALHWDTRVTRWLPGFGLSAGGTECTFRDLLLERTGLMEMPVVWEGHATLDEALGPLDRARATAPFGVRWQENALGVAVAAHAAARAAQRGDVGPDASIRLLAEKLFEPLGMTRTTADLDAVPGGDGRAVGMPEHGFRQWLLRRRPAVATTLGIWSCAADLARWLRFQLQRGRLEGHRLVSRERLEETWTPQVPLVAPVSADGDAPSSKEPPLPGAAMGWLVIGTRDDRLLLREGSIDGYTAMVALLPDRGIGIALLANRADMPLARAGVEVVLEALDGRSVDAGPARSPRDLVGLYRSDLLRSEVRVLEHRGTLLLQSGEQPPLELRPPGRDRRHRIQGSDASWVEFRFGPEGTVGAGASHALPAPRPERPSDDAALARWLRFDDMGLVLELPRVGVTFEPEIDAELAALLSGRFHDPRVGHPIEIVRTHEGRLQMRVPGQTAFDLRRSADDLDDSTWHLAMTPGTVLRFNRTIDGRATSITMLQGTTSTELPRLGDLVAGVPSPLPEAIERLAASMRGLLEAGGVQRRGTISLPEQGVTGTISMAFDGEPAMPRFRQELGYPPFGGTVIGAYRHVGRHLTWTSGDCPIDPRDVGSAWLAALLPIAPVLFTSETTIVDLDALWGPPHVAPDPPAPEGAGPVPDGPPPPTPHPESHPDREPEPPPARAAPQQLLRALVRLADGSEAILSIGRDDGVIHRIQTRAHLLFDRPEPLDIRFEGYGPIGEAQLPRRVIVETLSVGRLIVDYEDVPDEP